MCKWRAISVKRLIPSSFLHAKGEIQPEWYMSGGCLRGCLFASAYDLSTRRLFTSRYGVFPWNLPFNTKGMQKRYREGASKSLIWVTCKVIHQSLRIPTSQPTSTKVADIQCEIVRTALSFKTVTGSRKYLKVNSIILKRAQSRAERVLQAQRRSPSGGHLSSSHQGPGPSHCTIQGTVQKYSSPTAELG